MRFTEFDRVAASFDRYRAFPHHIGEQLCDRVTAALEAQPGTEFLDMGVGTGRVAALFLGKGYRYIGIDLSEAMIRRFREKLDQAELTSLVVGDVTRMPFHDGVFDVVIASSLTRVARPWTAAASEATRVLRRPGHVVLITHADKPGSMQDVLSIRKRQLLEEFGEGAYPRGGAAEATVARWFAEHGAAVEVFDTDAWPNRRTPRELIEQTLRGSRVADRPWAAELAAALEKHAADTYGSLDTEEQCDRHMTAFVAKLT